MDTDDEFRAFVRDREASLIRLAWALTGDPQIGEDIAQEAFQRLWTRWSRITNPPAYARKTIVNLSISWRRRRREITWPDVEPPFELQETEPERVAVRHTLRGWLNILPRRQRAVIVLRFLEDISVDETAAILGCTSGTVKSQTSKALTRLRQLIDDSNLLEGVQQHE